MTSKRFRRPNRDGNSSISPTLIEMDSDLKAKAQKLARNQRMSLTSLVENLLEAAVKEIDNNPTIAEIAASKVFSEGTN